MNMSQEQVQAGLAAGLALTDPEGNSTVPMKHAAGAIILRQILLSIGGGQIALNAVGGMDGEGKSTDNKGPTPTPRKKALKKK